MPKIHPFLWFDTQAEEAANFYVSVFPNSKVLSVSAMTVDFELDGFRVSGLNGGPNFNFTEATSFFIECQDQAEVDYYWDKLVEGGGKHSQCGWLKDRFGFSWQVVPKQLFETLGGSDAEGRKRAMTAMMQMTKLDIAKMQAAYAGKG
ncbi:MAG TPA: VOC family protein [Phenylobacterium sp.]|jgi:predicted 3-demethylubiquinone-9 3-methyltransferase (glyoxalase superfamily)|nr:VOC family protein [Phenylobacterium sp.]